MCELADGLHGRLVAIARAALPNEACGLLAGPSLHGEAGERVRVESVWPVENAHRSPHRFALDGAQMLEVEDRIESGGVRVIGVFHSHPTSQAVPSATDRADAASWDPQHRFVHVLVSMQGFVPTVRAWTLGGPSARDMCELTVAAGTGDRSHIGREESVQYPRG